MRVDFDNLRKRAATAYHNVATFLNSQIDREEGYVREFGVAKLQEEMQELRQMIGAICFCYDDKDPSDNNDLTEWWESQNIAEFAPENEEKP